MPKAKAEIRYHCVDCARARSNGKWEVSFDGRLIATVAWVNEAGPQEIPQLNERLTEEIAMALAAGFVPPPSLT